MMILIALISFALPALATYRDLNQGEADALYAIWGVRDVPSLMALEENPEKFWQETEYKLFESANKPLTHLDFCKWFIPKIKEKLAQKIEVLEKKPWFAGDIIEGILKRHYEECSPNFYYALTTCYAHIYDYTVIFLNREKKFIVNRLPIICSTKKSFEQFLSATLDEPTLDEPRIRLIPRCCETLLWQIKQGGEFSFIESLIAQSKGFKLCAISPNPADWDRFSSHRGEFALCSGILDHDAFGHGDNIFAIASNLEQYQISAQGQFNACCNPKALAAERNLITMSHKVQAWFTQFHEAPSQVDSFDPNNQTSLLFPGKKYLSDVGLLKITPYFAHLPLEHHWHTKPLPKADMLHSDIQGTLFAWRSLHCTPNFRFLQKDAHEHMKVLKSDLYYLTEPDLMRAPHFIQTILGDLCALEEDTTVTSSEEVFDAFLKKHQASAQKVIESLETLVKEQTAPVAQRLSLTPGCHLTKMQLRRARQGARSTHKEKPKPLIVHLPAPVCFLTITLYASKLRALRSECDIALNTEKTTWVSINQGDKCLWEISVS